MTVDEKKANHNHPHHLSVVLQATTAKDPFFDLQSVVVSKCPRDSAPEVKLMDLKRGHVSKRKTSDIQRMSQRFKNNKTKKKRGKVKKG